MPSSLKLRSILLGLFIRNDLLTAMRGPPPTNPPTGPPTGPSEPCYIDVNHTVIGDGATEVLIEVVDARQFQDDGYLMVTFHEGQFAGMTNVATWCVDIDRPIYPGYQYYADTFSSYGHNAALEASDAIDKPENLPAVNYLINEYPVGSTVDTDDCPNQIVTDREFQVAVWTLIDAAPHPENQIDGEVDCVVEYLIEVGNNNLDYEPDCNDPDALIGVVQVIDTVDGTILYQVMLSEIPLSQTGSCTECYDGGGGKTELPTSLPTQSPTSDNGGVNGDPHFRTFGGDKYDFHGLCDLVLLKNTNFLNGLGMDIHVRSKQWKRWSYISTAVIRIGVETFEVSGKSDGDKFWINQMEGNDDKDFVNEENLPSIAGYPISYRKPHAFQREYRIVLNEQESILIKVWKDFVRVDIQEPSEENFAGSIGLMGTYPKGNKVSRDGKITFQDDTKFGQEWQVRPSDDGMLFQSVDGPQHPSLCQVPTKATVRRRLGESSISEAEAEIACAHVSLDERDLCIFDVMASDNSDVAGSY